MGVRSCDSSALSLEPSAWQHTGPSVHPRVHSVCSCWAILCTSVSCSCRAQCNEWCHGSCNFLCPHSSTAGGTECDYVVRCSVDCRFSVLWSLQSIGSSKQGWASICSWHVCVYMCVCFCMWVCLCVWDRGARVCIYVWMSEYQCPHMYACQQLCVWHVTTKFIQNFPN